VVVTDSAMTVGFVAPSVTRLLGRDAAELSGRPLADLVHPDDLPLLVSLTGGPGVSDKGLIRFGHSDGSDRSFEVVVANRLADPAIAGLVLTGHDVTDRVQLEDRLSHDATHDGLTGLPNLALIRDRLDHALLRAERTRSQVAVVFGDLWAATPATSSSSSARTSRTWPAPAWSPSACTVRWPSPSTSTSSAWRCR
jgi:PAS domain S-box-containing protein